METQMKETHDKQAELNDEKQSYAPPRLKKLGTIRDLTLGGYLSTGTDEAIYASM